MFVSLLSRRLAPGTLKSDFINVPATDTPATQYNIPVVYIFKCNFFISFPTYDNFILHF